MNCEVGIKSKKAKPGEMIVTVFWGSYGVILIVKQKNITGGYYALFLDKLRIEIAERRQKFAERNFYFTKTIGHCENPRITF